MIDFIYTNEEILMNMTKHLNDKSVSEILALFICYDTFQYEEEKPAYFKTKIKILDSLINTFVRRDEMDVSKCIILT